MRVSIKVTKDDIKNGNRGKIRAQSCPIARAVKRRTGQEKLLVSINTITIWKSGALGSDVRIALPEEAREFVRRFDGYSKKPKPFKFTINIRKDLVK